MLLSRNATKKSPFFGKVFMVQVSALGRLEHNVHSFLTPAKIMFFRPRNPLTKQETPAFPKLRRCRSPKRAVAEKMALPSQQKCAGIKGPQLWLYTQEIQQCPNNPG